METISIVKKLSGHCLLYQRVSLTSPKALWVFHGKNILCFSVIEEVSINIRQQASDHLPYGVYRTPHLEISWFKLVVIAAEYNSQGFATSPSSWVHVEPLNRELVLPTVAD